MLAITGASGRLARLVTRAVRRREPDRALRLLTRNPEKLGPPGETVPANVRADFDDVAGLEAALAGVETLLLISTDSEPEQRIVQHEAAIGAARRAGVARIVYTSLMGARLESAASFARNHAATEAALEASGLAWTILRNAPYAEFLDSVIAGSMGANSLIMPAALAPIAYAPRANIAAALAGAMLGADHGGRIYEITGSHALAAPDIADLIGSVRGRTPEIVDADPWEYLQATVIPFGAPRYLIRAMEEHWAEASRGEYARVTSDAGALAGEALIGLPDYVRDVTRAGDIA